MSNEKLSLSSFLSADVDTARNPSLCRGGEPRFYLEIWRPSVYRHVAFRPRRSAVSTGEDMETEGWCETERVDLIKRCSGRSLLGRKLLCWCWICYFVLQKFTHPLMFVERLSEFEKIHELSIVVQEQDILVHKEDTRAGQQLWNLTSLTTIFKSLSICIDIADISR